MFTYNITDIIVILIIVLYIVINIIIINNQEEQIKLLSQIINKTNEND